MNSKTLVLVVASILVLIGLTKPDLSSLFNNNNAVVAVEDLRLVAPTNENLKSKASDVIKSLSVNSDRKTDGKRLASLYNDIATLVALDGEDTVIKNTEEIRQANKLSGVMLRLNIKNKYPDLSEAAQSLVVEAIGDDSVLLTPELRADAVESFKALAWACYEGSK
jgi:hypothetical protein